MGVVDSIYSRKFLEFDSTYFYPSFDIPLVDPPNFQYVGWGDDRQGGSKGPALIACPEA
jgi:hypothetical protein